MIPRAQFCWECGRQLYQRKIHVEKVIDGHPRILHKQCAESIRDETDLIDDAYLAERDADDES